jgi:hypothetical protein
MLGYTWSFKDLNCNLHEILASNNRVFQAIIFFHKRGRKIIWSEPNELLQTY